MSRPIVRWRRRSLAALLVGSSALLTGCDPTLRATVEQGIITSSTSLLTSFYQALLQVIIEENQSDPNAADPNQP
jgi:hypothetical protein